MGDIVTILSWTFFAFVVFLVLSAILGSFFTVDTAQVAIITRFGKFLRVANPGLNWKWPLIDSVAGRVSLRVNQITLTMETKTKDNVFVTIPISVQNRVRPEKVYDAYYKLSDPVAQIKSGCVAESMGENSYCCEQMDFFPPPTILSERSSPSRVRFAAPKNRRALDGSGPL